jgi:sarcosine oxidase
MGSAAACHLARRGLRVLALEQFSPGHDRGSSHGLTRIIRLAYHEDPSYVPLLRRAYALWRELEAGEQTPLLHLTGSLDIGREGSRVLEGSRRSCELHALAHETLSAREVRQRFPGYALPDEYLAVLQPDGGFLEPERCIAAHVAQAEALGAEVRAGVRVRGWRPRGDGVEVEAGGEAISAAHVVFCGGSWLPVLVPELAPWLAIERQVVGWFAVSHPGRFAARTFPIFNLLSDHGHFYGFPEFGVPGFKIGRYHHRSEPADPDAPDREVHAEDEALLRQCLRECFPDANGALLRASTCLFTNTPDEHFIIDRVPGIPQALLVSACSGHGFKFCSVIGEVVADLVTAGRTRHDISRFGIDRFTAAPPPSRQFPAGPRSGEP